MSLFLSAQLDIELPVTFEIASARDTSLKTHVGVLEFIAEEGQVHLPQWVCPPNIIIFISLFLFERDSWQNVS